MLEKRLIHEVPKMDDFHSAVMTTFSFDFHHFESQVLRGLRQKGAVNLSVLADSRMLDDCVGLTTGNVKSSSRAYTVSGIPMSGAFHPKITLLAGAESVMMLQGSGNVTNGGHGKNHELFTCLYADKNNKVQLPLIIEGWNYLKGLADTLDGIAKEKLDWVSASCPLLEENELVNKHGWHEIDEVTELACLYNDDNSGIYDQLLALLPKGIKEVKIFAPFYDEKGQMLQNLVSEYPEASFDVFLQPDKGIHPYKMEVPKNVSFYSWDSTDRAKSEIGNLERKLHCKVFWFKTEDAEYCLIGSPNASIAAFGSSGSRGRNEEFALLMKSSKLDFLKELELNGDYQPFSPQEETQVHSFESETVDDSVKNSTGLKILSIDLFEQEVVIYFKGNNSQEDAECIFFDQWGDKVESIQAKKIQGKVELKLSDPSNRKRIMFCQLYNTEGQAISNKQVVNSVHDLWSTNPSEQNRKLMQLASYIDTGKNGFFDIVEYYTTIHQVAERKEQKTNDEVRVRPEKEKQDDYAGLTYAEAISRITDNHELQKINLQHNTIKIWDALERFFRTMADAEKLALSDEEEEGDASISNDRVENEKVVRVPSMNSIHVLRKWRGKIEKFWFNYIRSVELACAKPDYSIGLVDMAMALIVIRQLLNVFNKKVELKVEPENQEEQPHILIPVAGSYANLNNITGAGLNVFGAIVNLLAKFEIDKPEDSYSKRKLERYENLLISDSLTLLALIKLSAVNRGISDKWIDLIVVNLLDKLGKPTIEWKERSNSILNDLDLDKKLKNETLDQIGLWLSVNNQVVGDSRILEIQDLGKCEVIKQIPINGKAKFLRLARPGFLYNYELRDFAKDELYNISNGEFMNTVQSLNSN